MLDVEGTAKTVKNVDKLLTNITNLIKKHWMIIIIILIGVAGYFVWNYQDTPTTPVENTEVKAPVAKDTVVIEIKVEVVEQDSTNNK